MSKNKKDLTVTEQLVVDHCDQYVRFGKEMIRSLADRDKRRELVELKPDKC